MLALFKNSYFLLVSEIFESHYVKYDLVSWNSLVLNKFWRNKSLIKSKFIKFNNFSSIHNIILVVKNWNANINFFLKARIYRSFSFINKFRLKNIFLKTVRDIKIWDVIF